MVSQRQSKAKTALCVSWGVGEDSAPHWFPHLMFFYSDTDPAIWGANLPDSPVIAVAHPLEHLTQFAIAVQGWSDGTEAR